MARMGPTRSGHVERVAGNLLKLARAQHGMSQRDLAEAAQVAQSTIARIESGARQPSLPVLARILAAIDQELKISLAPYEPHDDILDATEQRLSPEELACRHTNQDHFAAALRQGASR